MNRNALPKKRVAFVAGPALLVLFLLSQGIAAMAASAAAPSIYGWWSQASIGPIGPTVPPDVPRDGMFVQNVPTGPTAVSALQFGLPSGAVPDKLTLRITGTPVIAQVPVACLATSTFKPAQAGAWSDRPDYDCTDPVSGVVNADKTQVQFLVVGLATTPNLSVVVLAGGPTDRIAFVKPGPDALTFRAPEPVASPPPDDGASAAPVPSFTTGPPASGGSGQLPLPQSTTGAIATPGAPNPVVAPQPNLLGNSAAETTQQDSLRRRLGTTLGVILLLLSILYWSDGFGAFPLRSSLAMRTWRRAT